jgi:hypothetical protein
MSMPAKRPVTAMEPIKSKVDAPTVIPYVFEIRPTMGDGAIMRIEETIVVRAQETMTTRRYFGYCATFSIPIPPACSWSIQATDMPAPHGLAIQRVDLTDRAPSVSVNRSGWRRE